MIVFITSKQHKDNTTTPADTANHSLCVYVRVCASVEFSLLLWKLSVLQLVDFSHKAFL